MFFTRHGKHEAPRKSASVSDTVKQRPAKEAERGSAVRSFSIPGMAVLPFSFLFLELVLRFSASLPADLSCLVCVSLTALALGLLMSALLALIPSRRVVGILSVILTELITVWFLIAYFTNDSYDVFMDLKAIFGETGNVLNEFGSAVVSVILHGIPFILLYHVPVALHLLLWKKIDYSVKRRFVAVPLILVAAILCGFGGYAINSANPARKEIYTKDYLYNFSVEQLGLITSFVLDCRYSIAGNVNSDVISFTMDTDIPAPVIIAPPSDSVKADNTQEPDSAPAGQSSPSGETDIGDSTSDEGNSEGQALPPEEEVIIEYGYNVMDIDFDTLIESTRNEDIRSVHEYVQSLTPARQNKYTGAFEGKNLIMICVESFSKELIDKDRTPTLYRMANNGITLEDFYQPTWGGSTSTGEYSFVSGLIPVSTDALKVSENRNMYFTIGNQLQRAGYYSMAFHDGSYTYYSRNTTHPNLGYAEFLGFGNGLENYVKETWPTSDEEMVLNTLPLYVDHQPFSVYYMTIAGHFYHTFNGNAMAAKHRAVTEGLGYSETVSAYIAASQETEVMVTSLINTLDEQGILDDTVIVLCPDHFPYGLINSPTYGNYYDFLSEWYTGGYYNDVTKDHNQAIIWCREMEDWNENLVISTPTYSLDIVPTLSNLFGLEYDSRLLVGRDVLSDEEPLVIWSNRSWLTDKGYYNRSSGVFTPNEGVEVDQEYIARINAIAQNKRIFCWAVQNLDYYATIFGEDTVTTNPE